MKPEEKIVLNDSYIRRLASQQRILSSSNAPVNSLDFSWDDSRLLAAADNGRLAVYDVITAKYLRLFKLANIGA